MASASQSKAPSPVITKCHAVLPPRMYVPFAIRFQQIKNQGILKLKEAISLSGPSFRLFLNWWFSLALMSHHRQYGEYVLTGESDGNVDGEEAVAN